MSNGDKLIKDFVAGMVEEWELPVCSSCRKRRHEVTKGQWCSICQAVTATEVITVVEKKPEV